MYVTNRLRGPVMLSRCFSRARLLYLESKAANGERRFIKKLPLNESFTQWRKSLKANRLETLQNELIEMMVPNTVENSKIIRGQDKIVLDKEGNYINEVNFQIVNDCSAELKHIVFIHGYGASLGCFARNFELIKKFQDKKFNYKLHFLDNITFGLSSNPKVDNKQANKWKIERCPPIKLIDHDLPTDKTKLYNKYYKLIEGYQVNPEKFIKYQKLFTPVLSDLEAFYTQAINNWRLAQGISKIDYLVGHSFGGYWSASYSLKYPNNLNHLILLSPIGIERHVHAVTNDIIPKLVTDKNDDGPILKPCLDPTKYNFLSRYPILSKRHIEGYYWKVPLLPRILKYFGPWGYRYYFDMWYGKLFKINKVKQNITKNGDFIDDKEHNSSIYGTTREISLIVDYLFNAITNGSSSDIYVRNLLTPSSVSKYPIYDKFVQYIKTNPQASFKIDLIYGEYDFMNSEAGDKLSTLINENTNHEANVYRIQQGGHNLYIDNPWHTNQLIHDLVSKDNV